MSKNNELHINQILLGVSDQIRAGEKVSVNEVLADHPECADDLQSPLELLLNMYPHMHKELHRRQVQSDKEVERVNNMFDGLSITRVINRGAQATVYEAVEDKYGGRQVAVKIFHQVFSTKTAAHRFESEVSLTARLNHPNIVRLYQRMEVQGSACIVMEYIAGSPVEESLTQDGYSVRRCVEIFIKVCEAVAHAHNMGVLHRDLKPSNILLDTFDVPHVVDFGLAKDLLADSSDASLGMVIGTLLYMSPELARGESWLASIQSDVYSLGIVLHECLCGDYPFDPGTTREQSLAAILSRQRKTLRECMDEELLQDRVSELDDDLQSIISRAMSYDPSDRYSSAADMADDLSRWLSGDPIRCKSDRTMYVLGKQLAKYRRTIAIAIAFIAVTTLGAISTSVLWRRTAHQRDNFQTALTMAGVNAFANMQRDSGRTDSAIDLLGHVIELGASIDGLPEASRSSFRAASSLAQIYLSEGNTQKAQLHVSSCQEIVDQLRHSDKTNPEWLRLDVHAHYLQGKLEASRGNFDSAISKFDLASDLQSRLPVDKLNGFGVRNTAAQIVSNRARCLMMLHRGTESIATYQILYAIRKRLMDDDTNDHGRKISLAYALNGLASSYITAKVDGFEQLAKDSLQEANQLLASIPPKFERVRSKDLSNIKKALNYNLSLLP